MVNEENKIPATQPQTIDWLIDQVTMIKEAMGSALPDPIEGPQGPQGLEGPQGETGQRGASILGWGSTLPTSGMINGDSFGLVQVINGVKHVVIHQYNNGWMAKVEITGPKGPSGSPGSQVAANVPGAINANLQTLEIDGVQYGVNIVGANPDQSYDHLGLQTVNLQGTTYFVGGTWAKYLSGLLYEDDGAIAADETIVATSGIMTDEIDSHMGNGITIDDKVLVDGDLRTEEDLYVVGTATIDGLATFSDAILVDSIASATDQDTAIQTGKLAVTGNSSIDGNLSVTNGSLTVDNDADIGNDLTVYGTITVDSASSIVNGNGDPVIPSLSNTVTTNTAQTINGIKTFSGNPTYFYGEIDAANSIKVYSGGTVKTTLDTSGNIVAAGNISCGNLVTGNGKSVQTNRIDLTGNNNVIHFQSSSYSGNSRLHDDTQNADTSMNNLMDGHRVLVHNLRLVFNTDADETYPTGSRLGFQVNASKAGLTTVAALNNYPVGLFQGIPAWFDFGDHDRPIPGILADANFGATGHLKFCYFNVMIGDYDILDLLTSNISMVMDTRTAQV